MIPPKQSENIVYRSYVKGDELDIINLFNLIFKTKHALPLWRWAHAENPAGGSDINLAYYDTMFIGQSLGVPLLFIYDNKKVKTSRIQNVMVHADFRKKGIFLETLQRLAEKLFKQKVGFIFAFPNDYSIGAFINKLDYRKIADIYTMSLSGGSIKIDADADLKFDITKNISFKKPDLDFINPQLKSFKIYNFRSLPYLNWRYHKGSQKEYSVLRVFKGAKQVGLVVAKPYFKTSSIDLVEFIVENDEFIVRAALNAVVNFYKKDSLNSFNIWSLEHYPLHQILLKIGFTGNGQATHLVYKTVAKKYSKDHDKISSFYLSMGDSDVY